MRYNNSNTPWDGLRDFVMRGGIPVTTSLLLVNAVTFVLAFTSPFVLMFLAQWVAFDNTNLLRAPWTCLTYPLVYLDLTTNGLWNFLLGGAFFYMWSGSLERSWGSERYAKLFLVLTAVSEAFLLLGCWVLHEEVLLYSFFLPMAGVTVAFCTLRPTETVSFFFVPMQAKWIGWIAVAFTLVHFGQGHRALLGVFACGGMLAAYLYIRSGRWSASGGTYGPPRRRDNGPDLRIYPAKTRFTTRPSTALDGSPTRRAPLDLRGRLRDYQERRRLERLWKNSGGSDPEREAHDDEGRRR